MIFAYASCFSTIVALDDGHQALHHLVEGPTSSSKIDLSLGQYKWAEIWSNSRDTVVKFSARCPDICRRYEQNKGKKYVHGPTFVRKLVSKTGRSHGTFLKFTILSEMKSLMTQKVLLLYDNKKFILKKEP